MQYKYIYTKRTAAKNRSFYRNVSKKSDIPILMRIWSVMCVMPSLPSTQ